MMHDFQDKKVVVMGLGLHGGGLNMAKWFFTQGAEVIVTDVKTADQLKPSIEKLDAFCREYRLANHGKRAFHSVEYVLGGHREKDFITSDLIMQNPGVPRDNSFLSLARTHQIPIENEASLFFLLTPQTPKIGITGTRGKSTTTTLAYEMIKAYDPETMLGGNIITSTIGEIMGPVIARERAGKPMPVVLELSSWQLELLEAHQLSPRIGLVTNVMPDHLNRYGGMKEYTKAKTNVYRFQGKRDTAIFNYDNAVTRRLAQKELPGRTLMFSKQAKMPGDGVYAETKKEGGFYVKFRQGTRVQIICEDTDIILPGKHNLENILAAIAIAKAWGVPNATIQEVVRRFKGLPHRLEYLAVVKGRTFYNDTAATSPDATIAALDALTPKHTNRVVLIAGGADKNLEFKGMAQVIERSVHTTILLSGTATPHLATSLGGVSYTGKIVMANSMKEAVEKAWYHSKKDDTILLSPGCASFGMFTNEFERGNQFKELVSQLALQEAGAE